MLIHSPLSISRSELEKTTHAAELEGKQQEIEIQASTIAKYESEVLHLKQQVRQNLNIIIHIIHFLFYSQILDI